MHDSARAMAGLEAQQVFSRYPGDMGRQIAGFDWSKTSLGSLESWSPQQVSTVGLILSANVPMALLWGPDGVLIYNDGYAGIAGTKHPTILGRTVVESWPEAASFNQHVLDVGLGGGTLTYNDQYFALDRQGLPEDCWFDLNYSPVRDERGQPVAVMGIVYETTARHIAEQDLARGEERLSHALNAAGVIGAWDLHFDTQLMFSDPLFASFYSVDPERAERGLPREEYAHAIHPDDKVRTTEETERAIAEGLDIDLEHRIIQQDGTVRWVMVRGKCYRDASGKPVRLSGAAVDITERKKGEETRRLLIRELHHRVKNTFAIIGGMVTMTARTATSVDNMAQTLRGRLVALAGAHELIRPAITAEPDQAEQTTLDALLSEILAPHLYRPEQLTLDAPRIEIGAAAATSLALVLHELGTNASKYGSLSMAKGSLHVIARHEGDFLRLRWIEDGGPVVIGPPQHNGFGSRLASMSVVGQLGGAVEFHWKAAGLEAILMMSLDRLRR